MGPTYLTTLWNNFKAYFNCNGGYKELNPRDYDKALDFISEWEYVS